MEQWRSNLKNLSNKLINYADQINSSLIYSRFSLTKVFSRGFSDTKYVPGISRNVYLLLWIIKRIIYSGPMIAQTIHDNPKYPWPSQPVMNGRCTGWSRNGDEDGYVSKMKKKHFIIFFFNFQKDWIKLRSLKPRFLTWYLS